MKLSCTPISFHKSFLDGDMTLPRFIEYCAAQCLDGFDVLDTDQYPWLWSAPKDIEMIPQWIKKYGIAIAAYGCGNNFAKMDPDERAKQVESVRSAIRRARDCGASVIRIFGGKHQDTWGDAGVTTSRGMELIIEGLEACLPLAESCKIVLALENHGRLPGLSYESRAIIDHFASPWLKATYDPANYQANGMIEEEDPLRAYEALRDSIAYVHLKDVWPAKRNHDLRREPCVAGKGITPLRQVIAALTRDGYSGFCSLEYEAFEVLPEREGVAASLTYLKDAISSAAYLRQGK